MIFHRHFLPPELYLLLHLGSSCWYLETTSVSIPNLIVFSSKHDKFLCQVLILLIGAILLEISTHEQRLFEADRISSADANSAYFRNRAY